ncbi:MAG: hypothetical protein IJN16_04040 [Lachnospiraceae bacterium]|nr:hypothetical protein [Lachnospiraceae bacterium]
MTRNQHIFSKTISMDMDKMKRLKQYTNFLVLGRSGYGLNRAYIEPNLLTFSHDMLFVERNSQLREKYQEKLENNGYNVFVITGKEAADFNQWADIVESVVSETGKVAIFMELSKEVDSAFYEMLLKKLIDAKTKDNSRYLHVYLNDIFSRFCLGQLSTMIQVSVRYNVGYSIVAGNVDEIITSCEEEYISEAILSVCSVIVLQGDFGQHCGLIYQALGIDNPGKWNQPNDKCLVGIGAGRVTVDDKYGVS